MPQRVTTILLAAFASTGATSLAQAPTVKLRLNLHATKVVTLETGTPDADPDRSGPATLLPARRRPAPQASRL